MTPDGPLDLAPFDLDTLTASGDIAITAHGDVLVKAGLNAAGDDSAIAIESETGDVNVGSDLPPDPAIDDMIGLTDATVGRTLYESYLRFGVSGSEWSVPRIADYLMSKTPKCVIVPSYGEVDPDIQAEIGELMHPIWEGVYSHPKLRQNYRCAFSIKIQDNKYWYFYFPVGDRPANLATFAWRLEKCADVKYY